MISSIASQRHEHGKWLRVLNPQVLPRLGRIRHALFDFDGTLSLLRQGWEGVMTPMMLEMICGDQTSPPAIEQEVRQYIDDSTGILTIRQMEWLEAAVRRLGRNAKLKTAAEYKRIYLSRILGIVEQRAAQLQGGRLSAQEMMVAGALDIVKGLHWHGVHLYLASGTDHEYVLNESALLGLDRYFLPSIYGALDGTEINDKERVIQRILDEKAIGGEALIVIGDGPVEMRVCVQAGAIALGVASDEVQRSGWNEHKARRLSAARADLLVADFTHAAELVTLLTTNVSPEEAIYE